ncbi:L-type lectin-domain containing receptor kinase [Spatholobus suberectus]|nr:L-type lectin-domain containing receptor kinase [Spatholobus suberectus]
MPYCGGSTLENRNLGHTLDIVQELFFEGFKGATNIRTNKVAIIKDNSILRLINGTHQLGHAFYSTTITFKNSTDNNVFSFSIAFAFPKKLRPKRGAHGFSFVVSPSTELRGVFPSQYLDLFKPHDVEKFSNHIFAVEFDTVLNYEFYDINDNHVGVNVNSVMSNKFVLATQFIDKPSKQNLNFRTTITSDAERSPWDILARSEQGAICIPTMVEARSMM